MPNSNSERSKIQTEQLETKISTNPYFNKNLERENGSRKEQKVSSEMVVEEKSEPKIGVFGFKNEKYLWPTG